MKVTGGCHCRQVRFEARVDPESTRICHCNACQKLTGTAYRITVLARAEDVTLTGAAPARYVRTGDNGKRRVQFFCGTCGSPIATTGEGEDSGEWGIRWGAIDQRDELAPKVRYWAAETPRFAEDISALPRHERD